MLLSSLIGRDRLARLEHRAKELAGERAIVVGDLLRGSLGDDATAAVAGSPSISLT
jgi:hypothetical protein